MLVRLIPADMGVLMKKHVHVRVYSLGRVRLCRRREIQLSRSKYVRTIIVGELAMISSGLIDCSSRLINRALSVCVH
jgi:hypothetical protein